MIEKVRQCKDHEKVRNTIEELTESCTICTVADNNNNWCFGSVVIKKVNDMAYKAAMYISDPDNDQNDIGISIMARFNEQSELPKAKRYVNLIDLMLHRTAKKLRQLYNIAIPKRNANSMADINEWFQRSGYTIYVVI